MGAVRISVVGDVARISEILADADRVCELVKLTHAPLNARTRQTQTREERKTHTHPIYIVVVVLNPRYINTRRMGRQIAGELWRMPGLYDFT